MRSTELLEQKMQLLEQRVQLLKQKRQKVNLLRKMKMTFQSLQEMVLICLEQHEALA